LGFVQIAERLAADRRLHFVMTGAGPLAGEITARLAAAPALASRFHLLGNVASIDWVLASLDILTLPSNVDGRPLIVLEALAAGVPVVGSRVGGVPELIVPGTNGELCAAGDIDAFAQAIGNLAADRNRLARYKVGARSFAEEHLDERRMLERYAEVLGSAKCKVPRAAPARVSTRKNRASKSVSKGAVTRRRTAPSGAFRSGRSSAP
jgi:O-antigen biosynthesis protein